MTKAKKPTQRRIRRHSEPTAAVIPKPTKGKPEVIIPAKKRPVP